MSFPEGRKDWANIMGFVTALIGLIFSSFFGRDDSGK